MSRKSKAELENELARLRDQAAALRACWRAEVAIKAHLLQAPHGTPDNPIYRLPWVDYGCTCRNGAACPEFERLTVAAIRAVDWADKLDAPYFDRTEA